MEIDWVDVNEDLPGYKDKVLVTIRSFNEIHVTLSERLYTDKGGEHWLGVQDELEKVIAWASLPHPFEKA